LLADGRPLDRKERLRQAIKKENMTWRSWWDGGDTSGPIASQWNVEGWPTTYVLDHNGVIRYKNVREKELDEAVDTLEGVGKRKRCGEESKE